MLNPWKFLFATLFASGLFSCSSNPSATSYEPPLLNANLALTEIPGLDDLSSSSTSILIEKSEYRLTLLHNGEAIKQYPCVFGFNPTDDKRMEGDGCTPEGVFQLRATYPHDKWSHFLWVDYPTEASWTKHNASKAAGDIPETASIGGEIGIHGVPKGLGPMIDLRDNWTLGCISLKNPDIEEIYGVVEVGTEVEIVH